MKNLQGGLLVVLRFGRPLLVKSPNPHVASVAKDKCERDVIYCEESWSEWQDLNLRPPRPERGERARPLG
jgi:hypothetical protein